MICTVDNSRMLRIDLFPQIQQEINTMPKDCIDFITKGRRIYAKGRLKLYIKVKRGGNQRPAKCLNECLEQIGVRIANTYNGSLVFKGFEEIMVFLQQDGIRTRQNLFQQAIMRLFHVAHFGNHSKGVTQQTKGLLTWMKGL